MSSHNVEKAFTELKTRWNSYEVDERDRITVILPIKTRLITCRLRSGIFPSLRISRLLPLLKSGNKELNAGFQTDIKTLFAFVDFCVLNISKFQGGV